MARADRSNERRLELLPALAEAFSALGYRRASTASLAAALGTQETVLYRLWGSKKGMFLASLDHVVERSFAAWAPIVAGAEGQPGGPSMALLRYEASHHGEFGLYRLLFGALLEDDKDIRRALRSLYRKFHAFLEEHLPATARQNAKEIAWALIGLGHISAVTRELRLVPAASRRSIMETAGQILLGQPL